MQISVREIKKKVSSQTFSFIWEFFVCGFCLSAVLIAIHSRHQTAKPRSSDTQLPANVRCRKNVIVRNLLSNKKKENWTRFRNSTLFFQFHSFAFFFLFLVMFDGPSLAYLENTDKVKFIWKSKLTRAATFIKESSGTDGKKPPGWFN